MKKNTSKKRVASKGKKETKDDLAFYIGIDLGDRNATSAFWIRAAKWANSSGRG